MIDEQLTLPGAAEMSLVLSELMILDLLYSQTCQSPYQHSRLASLPFASNCTHYFKLLHAILTLLLLDEVKRANFVWSQVSDNHPMNVLKLFTTAGPRSS